jgi:hypothetical protein
MPPLGRFIFRKVVDVGDARRVAQEVVDADPAAVRIIGQDRADRRFQIELALLGEEHDRGGGERLRQRGDVEDGAGAVRHLKLDAGEAVALLEHDPVALGNQDDAAEIVRRQQRREIGIDRFLELGRRRGRGSRHGERRRQCQEQTSQPHHGLSPASDRPSTMLQL